MGTIPSIDAALNLSWVLVMVATLLLSRRSRSTRQHKRALVALLFILVMLFPVISTADDAAQLTLLFDPSPSTVTLESGKEIKQVLAPAVAAIQAGHGMCLPLTVAASEAVTPETPGSGIFLLVSSGPGIHSPPRS